MTTIQTSRGVSVIDPVTDEQSEILTPDALEFIAALHREFNPRRLALLQQRKQRQAAIDRGDMPGFLTETEGVRTGEWKVLPVPDDFQDRRVEITGPVDRKMVINALNSGARCYMADFEDAHFPDMGRNTRWPNQPARCRARHDRTHQRRREKLPAEPPCRHPAGPPAWLAPARETRFR